MKVDFTNPKNFWKFYRIWEIYFRRKSEKFMKTILNIFEILIRYWSKKNKLLVKCWMAYNWTLQIGRVIYSFQSTQLQQKFQLLKCQSLRFHWHPSHKLYLNHHLRLSALLRRYMALFRTPSNLSKSIQLRALT